MQNQNPESTEVKEIETSNLFKNNKKSHSKMNKFWMILLLLVILLIPIAFMYGIISDREDYHQEAVNTVASSWAKQQFLESPNLYFMTKSNIKENQEEAQYLILNDYNADIQINTEIRKKGIFKVPVYTADVYLKGDFKNEYGNLSSKNLILSFPVSDTVGFIKEPTLKLNNEPQKTLQSTEYHTTLNTSAKNIPFEISYKIRGSNELTAGVDGQKNNIKISGNWKNPSFNGNFLPAQRTVNNDYFEGNWSVPVIAVSGVNNPSVGVSLLLPVDNYRMTERTLKYAFLFLTLTFLSYFIFEITSTESKRIHPLQYLMLGAGMLMFYLLLVSISEYIPFAAAYIIASAMVIGISSTYTYFAITKGKNKNFAFVIAALLFTLYLFLYILLSLQDFALLIGSLGLFVIIGAIMYVTRNIDWYNGEE